MALQTAVLQGQLAGLVDAELAAAKTAVARLKDQGVAAREASTPALEVGATGQCSNCRGRGSTLSGACSVCLGRVRQGLLAGLVDAEVDAAMTALLRLENLVVTARAAAKAASPRLEGQVVAACGASTPELEVGATEQCSNCLGSGSTVFGTCSKCHGSGRGPSSVLTMAGGRPLQ